jgi:hypothetical protein
MANLTISALDLRCMMKEAKGFNRGSVARKAFSLGPTLETIAETRRCVEG